MPNRSPAFQFYPDKWQSHTRRLSDSAYRVYHEMMCWMWLQSPDQVSIPSSPEAIAVLISMPTECVRIAVAEIQNEHAPLLKVERGRFVSNGLRKEAKKQAIKREKASESAKTRWNPDAKRTQCVGNADASSKQCIPIPTPIPIPSPTPIPSPVPSPMSDPELSGKPDSILTEFEECWKLYPDKAGKAKAETAYRKWRKAGDTQADVLAGINRYLAFVAHKRTHGQPDLNYKNGSTWFNQRCWTDEYTTGSPPLDAIAQRRAEKAAREYPEDSTPKMLTF